MYKALLATAGALAAAATLAGAQLPEAGIGRPVTQAEARALDIDVGPDGEGLPIGRGTAMEGRTIYASRCAACHGTRGQGIGAYPALVGGQGTLASDNPLLTVGSYWPYATTLWDYIHRAMPYPAPGSLTASQTYAVAAYILFLNHIIGPRDVLDATTLPQVRMPNRGGFTADSALDALARGQREGGQVVPIRYEDGRIYVPVSAELTTDGGTRRVSLGWFILDTGADGTVVDVGVARRLHIATHDREVAGGAGAGAISITHAGGIALRVGETPFRPHGVVVAPLDSLLWPSSGRHVSGIIGIQFFAEHAIDLRAPWHAIVLDQPVRADVAKTGTTDISLRVLGSLPLVDGTAMFGRGRDQRVLRLTLLLDLGAKAPLLLTESALARMGGEAKLPPHVLAPLGAGFGGETRYYFTHATELAVGTNAEHVRTENVVAGFSAFETLRDTAFDGLLGAPFLSRFDVHLDLSKRQLVLTRERRRDQATGAFDESGLYLVARDTPHGPAVFVRRVIPRSPAARAGLLPGDRIATVDARPAGKWSLAEIREVLRGAAGGTARLVIARSSGRQTVTVALTPLF